MEDDEKNDLIRIALQKLSKIKMDDGKAIILEDMNWVFNIFSTNYYEIGTECTKEELHDFFEKKHIVKTEKEALLLIVDQLERLKFETDNPAMEDLKDLFKKLSNFIVGISDKENKERVVEEAPSGFMSFFRRRRGE